MARKHPNSRSMKKLLLLTLATLMTLGSHHAQAVNLVQSPNVNTADWFKSGDATFVVSPGGDGAGATSNNQDFGYFLGPDPGSFWQTLATTAGQTYLLSLYEGTYGGGGASYNILTVLDPGQGSGSLLSLNLTQHDPGTLAIGGGLQGYLLTTANDSATNMSQFQFEFTAYSTSTMLKFTNYHLNMSVGVINQVSLTEVAALPEPSTCVMFAAGLGGILFMARSRRLAA